MTRAAMMSNYPGLLDHVYGRGRKERIAELCDLYPETITARAWDRRADVLGELEVVFSTWGFPRMDDERLEQLPKLQAVFYAAGTVKSFAERLLERGITVVSGWAANAVPVAEFTVAQIILANKGYFRNVREYADGKDKRKAFRGAGNFERTVALLGAGQIGRAVIRLLKPFDLHVLVFDPFLPDGEAEALGVEKVSLTEAFARGDVVSNHLADKAETRGLVTRELLASLPENAAFLNTGRGGTVVEKDLVAVLGERPDLTALLDVTRPEPPKADSPLWTLPNAILSSHIAGAMGDEVLRIADTIIQEFQAWQRGENLRYAVSPEMLQRMA